MAKDTGGPAFPIPTPHGPDQLIELGMTLRDWFAGQALAGIMAQSHAGPKNWQDMGHGWGEDTINKLNSKEGYVAKTMARFAYQIADAMLAERALEATS